MVVLPYRRLAAIMKYLCIVLLVYLVVPFLSHQHLGNVLWHTFVPQIEFSREFLLVASVGILGTTISPYLFFWQTSMEVEEMHGPKKAIVLDKLILPRMHKDVGIGMFFSVLVMYFITLTAGTVLHESGLTEIETVEDAAKALRPLAGNFSYGLFALGVLGTGLLAVLVLAGSLSYILSANVWLEGRAEQKISPGPGVLYCDYYCHDSWPGNQFYGYRTGKSIALYGCIVWRHGAGIDWRDPPYL